VALNGVPASKVRTSSDTRWVLAGDRGITYAAAPPEGTDITNGRWWPTSYTGPTRISFDGDLAPGLGLKLGDTITLNVLGREIEGRIANFRHVSFRNGQQNFVLILSPGLIDKAPHSFLATVRVPAVDEEALYRNVTDRFPNISVVRVKDSIAQVNNLIQELVVGIRVATLVTILAGLLVLSGAIAAGGRTRLYDATIFKVLGATRGTILLAYAIEYGLLGLLTGVIAFGLGGAAAYAISRWLLDIPFAMDTEAASTTIVGGAGLTLVFGLVGAWNALAAKPIGRLRAP
jgi:putative ABC transport system permease protein